MEVFINFNSKLLAYAFFEILGKMEGVTPCLPEESKCKEPDIILTDYFSLNKEIISKFPKAKLVLVDTGLRIKSLLRVLMEYKVAGIIAPYTDLNLFKKALKVINDGQIWLDNKYLKHLLNGMDKVSPKGISLTSKEKDIIFLVCEGLSNKEIADKLNISEQTVKAHLHRIFRKFNISSRTQLINIFLESINDY
jgi:DNA-binding NarL/FixJ family response regulator